MNPAVDGLAATKEYRGKREPEAMLLLCQCVENMTHSLYKGREIRPEAVQGILRLIQRVEGLEVALRDRLKAQGVKDVG